MNEEERQEMQLTVIDVCDKINPDEEACLYIYANTTYDMVCAGDHAILVDAILETMRNDEGIKDAMREAVQVIDLEEGINFRVN